MNSQAWLLVFTAMFGSAITLPAQAQAQQPDGFFEGKLRYSPEEEAVYLERYNQAQNRNTADEIYTPLESVAGVSNWKPLPSARPHERTISKAALQDASAYAAANNSHAFIVWRDGKVEAESYFGGQARTSAINALSLSKPVTVAAVGRAIMLGKIKSLDQPVADFVTEWKADPLRARILVRHLLDMRAGFLAQLTPRGPNDILSRTFLHPRHDEIIIQEYPVVDEPGARYEYNNAASDMVAVLIERATGRRYGEFVGTEIWQKIGAMGGAVWVNREGGMAHAGCCMLVPSENFLRLAILTLQDGVWDGQRLLPEAYVAAMKTPTAQNPYHGLGLYVAGRYNQRRGFANPDRPARKVWHSAPYLAGDLYLFDGNANQVVYVIPSQNLVILRTGILQTGNNPRPAAGAEWDNAYLPNTILRGIVKDKRESLPQQR
jgi:CubicO group peptidase (beta-lactamase class C family)